MALLSKIKPLLGNMKLFQMRWQINIHLLLWYKHRQNSDQLCEYNWHFRRFWKHVYFRIFWKHVCWFRIHILVFKTSHEDIELHLKNLVGFCSDRANIMTGKEIGVAAKFKKLLQCENMLKMHCICHWLALARADAGYDLHVIKDFETTVIRPLSSPK